MQIRDSSVIKPLGDIMPVDSSIALGVRPPQFADPLQQYGNVLAIQNAGNQNALSQYTLARAKREDEDTNALRRELAGVGSMDSPEGLRAAQNALMRVGRVKEAQELGKSMLDREKTMGEINKQKIDQAFQHLDMVGRSLANVQTDEQALSIIDSLTKTVPQQRDAVMAQYTASRQSGKSPQQVAQEIAASYSKHALDKIKAFAPEVDFQNLGGTVGAMNKNALAAPVGPMAGVAPIAKTATPGEIMTDARGRDFNATAQAAVAATRANTQANRDIAREQTQAQREIGNASNIRDEQTKALKPIDDVQQKLTIAKQLLATSSPASDIQLQQALTDLFDNARATNMLFNANKNFGTLAGRAAGLIGRMFTGQYTDKQRSEIGNLITEMEKNVLSPTRSRVESHYKGIAQATGVNPALTQTPNFYSDQNSGSAQSEADAFLRGAANAKPR